MPRYRYPHIRYCIYFVHLLAVTVRRSIASYNRDFLAISGDYRRWREPANCEAPVIALVDISASKLGRYYTHTHTLTYMYIHGRAN